MTPEALKTLAVQALEDVVKSHDEIDQHDRPYIYFEGPDAAIQFARGDAIPAYLVVKFSGRLFYLYLQSVDQGLMAFYKWIPEHDRVIAGEAACQKK